MIYKDYKIIAIYVEYRAYDIDDEGEITNEGNNESGNGELDCYEVHSKNEFGGYDYDELDGQSHFDSLDEAKQAIDNTLAEVKA